MAQVILAQTFWRKIAQTIHKSQNNT